MTFQGKLLILLLALVTLPAACGGSNERTEAGARQRDGQTQSPRESEEAAEPSGEASPAPRSNGKAMARVVDTAFAPETLTVEAGTEVVWRQTGKQPHSVTANDEGFDSSPKCSPLNSDRCLEEGDSFFFTFEEPGSFKYYCRVHGLADGTGMVGVVKVE